MLVNKNIHKSGLLPSRAYCVFARLTNSNVLGKFPIHDSNNRVNWKLLLVDMPKIYTRDGEETYRSLYKNKLSVIL
jgi:hypothetical protein